MFCKYCGKEIDNNSKYCSYCGKEVKQTLSLDNINGTSEDEFDLLENKAARKKAAIILIAIFAFLIIVMILIVKNTTGPITKTNYATNYDIKVQTSPSLITYTITVTPQKNITNLQIEFDFYGDDNKKIVTKTKSLGNVKKNVSYDASFSVSEFSLSSLSKISKMKWKVTNGVVAD